MKNDIPRISVLVACYNNQNYIKETITSIFQQSYPNIEIIIGDDGSREFDEAGLSKWIEQNRTPNISNVKILANKVNRGTVANVEHMQQESSGEYLLGIAADDTLYDENVLETLYHKLIETGAEFVVSQTEMWDEELKFKIRGALSPRDIDLIKNGTAQQLFEECSHRALLPACYLYRRSLLDKIGKLSDQYRLVEDYPFQLRATRLGIKPAFSDIPSTIKHRHGGISHGHKSHTSRTVLIYRRDCIWAYINEILPYEDMLSEKGRDRARLQYIYQYSMYKWVQYPDYLEGLKKGKHSNVSPEQDKVLELPGYYPKSRNYLALMRNWIKIAVYRLIAPSAVRRTFIVAFLLLILACFTKFIMAGCFLKLGAFLAAAAALALGMGVCQIIMLLFMELRHRILQSD